MMSTLRADSVEFPSFTHQILHSPVVNMALSVCTRLYTNSQDKCARFVTVTVLCHCCLYFL